MIVDDARFFLDCIENFIHSVIMPEITIRFVLKVCSSESIFHISLKVEIGDFQNSTKLPNWEKYENVAISIRGFTRDLKFFLRLATLADRLAELAIFYVKKIFFDKKKVQK